MALPFIFLRLLWRSRRLPDYHKGWAERLGFCPWALEKSIWIHAVSVGETLAAIPLIKMLLKEFPQLPVVVSNMTPTGAARVKAALGDSVKQVYIPYDLPAAVDRFLQRIHPRVVIIMETELWPNLLASCRQQSIPVVIANARLSEKSAKGYACIPWLSREMMCSVHSLAAQANADAERFVALGLPRERMMVTGNLKFDLDLPEGLSEKSVWLRDQLGRERSVWIAASTHPGEEEIILTAHQALLNKDPQMLLVLVPGVAELIAQRGLQFVQRSEGGACSPQTSVYLGDTMGELLLMYAAADIAFVAGSFSQTGGHNLLEPAALRKPVITGPVLFNFLEISQLLLAAKGMVVVQNAETLAAAVEQFFKDSHYRDSTGENAYQVVMANRGALQKQFELIKAAV
jgi:3-deoxy-D-manno-octulosonic-acid transferase